VFFSLSHVAVFALCLGQVNITVLLYNYFFIVGPKLGFVFKGSFSLSRSGNAILNSSQLYYLSILYVL